MEELTIAAVLLMQALPGWLWTHGTTAAEPMRGDFGSCSAPAYPMYFTSHNEIAGKNSSSSVRAVSLMRKGNTPR